MRNLKRWKKVEKKKKHISELKNEVKQFSWCERKSEK